MRFASFNVLHGRTLHEGRPVPGPSSEHPLAQAVASLDADVLALQEVDRCQERSGGLDQARVAADAARAPHWRYASAVHGRAVPDSGWLRDPTVPGLRVHGPRDTPEAQEVPSHGIALLSRAPVREWRARRFGPAPFGMPLRVPGRPGLVLARDQPRAALAAVIDGPGGPFTVVALHLSFVPGWNVRQLLAVRAWIADLPRPCVLLGDFNLTGPIPRAVLSTPRRERAREGWRDAARIPTYPAHRPLVQFDHVLLTGAVHAAPAGASAPRTAVSDHRPVVVDLCW